MPTIHTKLMNGKYGPCWTERNTKPTWIVLHHTASSASSTDPTGGANAIWNYFYGLTPGNRVSCTDVLGKNGYILRMVSPLDSAWHSGTSEWNNKSIGIEIVNKGDNRDPFPDAQIKNLAWLVHKYMKDYSIKRDHIRDHKSILSTKIDMRANFPWDKMYRYIKEYETGLTSADIVLPVPVKKPSWWDRMVAWRRTHKRRRV